MCKKKFVRSAPIRPPPVFFPNPMISWVINIRWVAEKHKDGVTNHTTISGFL